MQLAEWFRFVKLQRLGWSTMALNKEYYNQSSMNQSTHSVVKAVDPGRELTSVRPRCFQVWSIYSGSVLTSSVSGTRSGNLQETRDPDQMSSCLVVGVDQE